MTGEGQDNGSYMYNTMTTFTIFSMTSLKLTVAGADTAFCMEDCVLHKYV